MYTVRYVVRASTLLPLSGPLSQRAIAVKHEIIAFYKFYNKIMYMGH
jgi:hypothetical protein